MKKASRFNNMQKRIFFTDNFYTMHNLAMSLKQITDGEARIKLGQYDGLDDDHSMYKKLGKESHMFF